MSHLFACALPSVSNHRSFANLRRLSGWWLITIALIFIFFGEPLTATAQQRSTGVRPRVVNRTPPAVTQATPANDGGGLQEDTVIAAENRKVEARRLAERRQIESEVLAKNESAQTPSADLWRGFRKTYPFHNQVLALSDAQPDGSRTLIVSEPPPHITLGEILTTISDELVLSHKVESQVIGYDGWVKDVVVAVKGTDGELQGMLSRLNQRLFFTSYKSYTLKLPVELATRRLDLNLTVTPDEMKHWVVDEGERFFPVEGGQGETLTGLAGEQTSGVYVSSRRGLIGWWIPKKRNLYECRVPARQFALDSDLVIGALATPSGIFVLGRERIVPVDMLPPLRFETLALLADAQEGQNGRLEQSYERRHAFAGRIEDGNDWAPIRLSPQLRDTEYGSLLNITDQLLKGWSNKGETKYRNFPYPEPGEYPFPKPLWEELGAGSLTYNWNTKGAGYTVNFGPVTAMALNRSGSLPVSYIPEGVGRADSAVIRAEDSGYDYFSRLSDPNLVRVVQYAGIYQIFSAFNVAHSPKIIPADNYPDQLLESMTNDLYAELRRSSDGDLSNLAEQLSPVVLKSLDDMITDVMAEETGKLKRDIDTELRRKGYEPGSSEYKEKFEYVLNEMKKEMAQQLQGAVAKDIKQQLEMAKLNLPAKDAFEASLRKLVLSQFAALRQVPQRYAEAIDLRAEGWIHTPVVVISWNRGGDVVGGHNLDARVSKIKADERVPPGQVGIDAEGDLLVNPTDLPRARGLARGVERNGLIRELALAAREGNLSKVNSVQAEMQNALNRAEEVPVRPRETALHLASSPPIKPPVNKPPISTGEPDPAGGAGWGGEGRSTIPITSERRDSNVIQIKQRGDNRFDVEYSLPGGREALMLTALTHEDAVDAAVRQAARRAKPGEPVVVRFDEMPEQRAWATLRTMEIRISDQDQPVELVGLVAGKESLVPTDSEILRQYDFGRANVEVSEVQSLPTGELQQEVSLNAPAVDNSGGSVRFTSEMRFDKWTPRTVVEAIRGRVVEAFRGIAKHWSRLSASRNYRADVSAYDRDLAIAVKKVKARTKLNFDVKTRLDVKHPSGEVRGLRDIYIGQEEHARTIKSDAGAHQAE